jgi:hypothetical protein
MATIKICDICGSNENVNTRKYITGQTYNGVDYDNNSEYYDLCVICENKVLQSIVNYMFKTMNDKYEINKNTINFIKKLQG